MQQPGVNAAGIITDKDKDKESAHPDAHAASGHKSRTDSSGGSVAKPGTLRLKV